MKAKLFSYKVEGVLLVPFNNDLKLSPEFDKKELLDRLRDLLKEQQFEPDERSLNYKIVDDQLHVQGIAVERHEPKTVGFMMGN
jgi:hypothetical protein